MKKWILLNFLLVLLVNFSFAQEAQEQTSQTGVVSAEISAPGMITFSFKDADIRNVLRLISAKSGVNIVYGPEVTGVVNMELKDVPWEQALELVLDVNGFAYQRKGNVIKVIKKEDVAKEPLSTEVFMLNYAKAEDAVKSVEQMLTERGSIKTDTRSNTIIVTDVPANINKIEAVLTRLDTRTPQVLIEAKIIEMTNTKEKELGIEWTSLKEYTIGLQSPTRTYKSIRRGGEGVWDDASEKVNTEGRNDVYTTTDTERRDWIDYISENILPDTHTRSIVNTNTLTHTLSRTLLKSDIRSAILSASDFQLVLSALESQADVNLISNPRVLTANNETAQIKVVEEYPIPNYTYDTSTAAFTISGFTYKDIGVTFDVTPNISADGYITMKIEPQVSKLLGTIPFTASGSTVNIPLVGSKKASAKMVLKSGDTLAVGGLIDEDKTNTVTKVPLLGDIPVLGRLFRHEGVGNIKKDIIFFITATIIDEETKRLISKEDVPIGQAVETAPPQIQKRVFKKDQVVEDKNLSNGNRGVILGKKNG